MALEVSFGWTSGRTLTFGVYTSAGVEREVGTAMTETPAGSGLYLGTPTTVEVLDYVIVKEGTAVVGFGQYQPEISADQLAQESGKPLNVYDETRELTRADIVVEL